MIEKGPPEETPLRLALEEEVQSALERGRAAVKEVRARGSEDRWVGLAMAGPGKKWQRGDSRSGQGPDHSDLPV